jgi:hypothetical protein
LQSYRGKKVLPALSVGVSVQVQERVPVQVRVPVQARGQVPAHRVSVQVGVSDLLRMPL